MKIFLKIINNNIDICFDFGVSIFTSKNIYNSKTYYNNNNDVEVISFHQSYTNTKRIKKLGYQ